MLEAAWTAAEALPEAKQARLKPLFAPLALQLQDAGAKAVWQARLADMPVQDEAGDYVRRTAETAIGDYGWEGFLQRAQDARPPLHVGRPEIMAAAIELAPDIQQRARIIDMMFTLAGTPGRGVTSGISINAFERADFGHVLAERMMRDCRLAEFDRAVGMTASAASLRYALWRARITGGAGALADDIRRGDEDGDTRHVRQALEGYGAILSLGYCPA
ncbi:MAG: hypothetical protein ACO33A_08450 [Hyphomonas sp.]